MPRQRWLADIARAAGLEVVEVDGWPDRGSEAFNPGGVVEHHTAGARTGDMPSLRILVQGRSDLPGPLCNYGVSRSGKVYVIAAGRANHAGSGGWQGMRGNSAVIGVEYENVGTGAEPWSAHVLDVGSRLTRAVMAHLRREVRFVCEHKEWAPGRKVDRHTIVGDRWRQLVAEGGGMATAEEVWGLPLDNRVLGTRETAGELLEAAFQESFAALDLLREADLVTRLERIEQKIETPGGVDYAKLAVAVADELRRRLAS